MLEYPIKPLDPEDLPEALELIRQTFLEFEAPDYSAEGIAEFQAFIDRDAMTERLKSGDYRIWTAHDGPAIVGVIALRAPRHLSLLFVAKTHHRLGIARALLQVLADQTKNADTPISVNSSPYAHEAYKRLGFHDVNTEQLVNGIRYIPMQKHIILCSEF